MIPKTVQRGDSDVPPKLSNIVKKSLRRLKLTLLGHRSPKSKLEGKPVDSGIQQYMETLKIV